MARAVNGVKASYKVTNWAKYNESLVKRGDITFWFAGVVMNPRDVDFLRLGHQLGELAATDGDFHHIAEELAEYV